MRELRGEEWEGVSGEKKWASETVSYWERERVSNRDAMPRRYFFSHFYSYFLPSSTNGIVQNPVDNANRKLQEKIKEDAIPRIIAHYIDDFT